MKTIFTILILITTAIILVKYIGVLLLNIVGIPGALIGRTSKNKKNLKFVLGVIVSLIPHLYLYLSYMIYIITWTKQRIVSDSISKYFIWFFCMVATLGVIQKIYQNAKKDEDNLNQNIHNPQITSLRITEFISYFCFFLFIFYPELIKPFWNWVLNIWYPFI